MQLHVDDAMLSIVDDAMLSIIDDVIVGAWSMAVLLWQLFVIIDSAILNVWDTDSHLVCCKG